MTTVSTHVSEVTPPKECQGVKRNRRRPCITWDPTKSKCPSPNYNDCLVEAFWQWLGLDDCGTISTNTTVVQAYDLPMFDLPMFDDVTLVETSCSLKTKIIYNLETFIKKPNEMRSYWKTLFQIAADAATNNP